MSSIVRVRWAAPTAAVALGVLTIGGSLTHVPLVGAVDAAFQPRTCPCGSRREREVTPGCRGR